MLAPMGKMLSPHDLRTATAVIEASVPMICEGLMLVPHLPRHATRVDRAARAPEAVTEGWRQADAGGDDSRTVTIDAPTCRATIRDGL